MLRSRRREDELKETIYPSDPHTRVKHGAYRFYLGCWLAKILQGFRGGATIVDAFAGAGIYSDELDGSSVLVAKAYLGHRFLGKLAPLDLLCLEERPDRVEVLRQQFAKLGRHPKLNHQVLDAGRLEDHLVRLSRMAHRGNPRRPVLWLLDPYKPAEISFEVVKYCLACPRDEVIVSFFADHMHRFCGQPGWPDILDKHFGGSSWRAACELEGTAQARKDAFVSAYRQRLEAESLETASPFAVQIRGQTAGYYLVLATHNTAGLECWNANVLWRMDRAAGAGASARTLDQPTLFEMGPDLEKLRARLLGFIGEEAPWDALSAECHRAGFTERHLREVLDQLAAEGVAFRTYPPTVSSPARQWPKGSTVRFYNSESAADDNAGT